MTKAIERQEQGIDPWGEFDRIFDEVRGRLFDPFAGISPRVFAGPRSARTDVKDTGTAYRIVAEIPGIPKENLDIRVRGTTVEIRGASVQESETKDEGYLHRERNYAGYHRFLELPEAVVASEARAKVENGLLELELPKEHPKATPDEVKVPVQ